VSYGNTPRSDQFDTITARLPGLRPLSTGSKDHHRKEDHGWLPHRIDGALQRRMEWVMYPAGLLSGAPAR